MRISPEVEIALSRRRDSDAARRRHEYVTVEHLLYALLFDDDDGQRRAPRGRGRQARSRRSSSASSTSSSSRSPERRAPTPPPPSLGVQRAIRRAATHVQSSRQGGGDGRERPRRDLRRARLVRGRAARGAGRHPARRGRVHLPRRSRRLDDEPAATRDGDGGDRAGDEPGASPRRTRSRPTRSTSTKRRRHSAHRPAGRARERGRAHHPDPRAAQEEQPAPRRRRRASARPPSSRGWRSRSSAARSRKRSRTPPSTRSTWARCSPARATAATSRSASRRSSRRSQKIDGAILFIDEIHTIVGAGATSGGSMDASQPAQARARQRAGCAASARPRSRSTAQHFEKDRALVAALPARRGGRAERRGHDQDPRRACASSTRSSTASPTPTRRIDAAAELVGEVPARPASCPTRRSISSTRRARRRSSQRRRAPSSTCADVEPVLARMAQIPPREVSTDDRERLRNLETRPARRSSSARTSAHRQLVSAIKLVARRAAGPEKPIGSLPLHRPHRRRQDRGRQAARQDAGHRVPPLRHERVHGAAHRLAPHRRAARLRRLRPGRPADRRHREDAARRAPARRDREGPPATSSTCCSR